MATTQVAPPPPPLERILPYVVSLFSTGLSFASAFTRFVSVVISNSLSFFSPLPIIYYAFAPLIVFFEIITDAFIRWPHRIALYALDAFYPIYVFCGVACIVGVLLGTMGRVVSLFLIDFLVEKELPPPAVVETSPRMGRKTARRKRETARIGQYIGSATLK